MPPRRQRGQHELTGPEPEESGPAGNTGAEAGMRCKGCRVEGGNAAPAEGDAALAQESIRLVPQAGKAEAAAVLWQQIDVEIPGRLAGGHGQVTAAHLILVVAVEAEPKTADDHPLLESGKTDRALTGSVSQHLDVKRERQKPRVLRIEPLNSDRPPAPGRQQRL